ncbi:MAG: hypothetical protein HYV63_00985, partial [Candidatus Schekmanbacteria bacterium]|nr:hypothetical protein [Candidatus Schekmanbacteria bacterium]
PGIATNYPADNPGSEDDVQYRVTYKRGGAPAEVALGSASGFAYAELLENHVAKLFWDPSVAVPMRYQRGGPLEESRETLETVRIDASATDFGAHGHFAVQVDVEGEKSYVGLPAGAGVPAKELLQLPLDNDKTGLPDDETIRDTWTTLEDTDAAPPVSGSPAAGLVGDGFTAYEEFRGFVVDRVLHRTDPSAKDLFVVPAVDRPRQPVLDLPTRTLLAELLSPMWGLSVHVLRFDVDVEANEEHPMEYIREEAKRYTVVNKNSAAIPGTHLQSGLRIEYRWDYFQQQECERVSVLGATGVRGEEATPDRVEYSRVFPMAIACASPPRNREGASSKTIWISSLSATSPLTRSGTRSASTIIACPAHRTQRTEPARTATRG